MTLPVSWALQVALFQHLSADADLRNTIGTPARIYDDVPLDPVFPFLTIGETRAEAIAEAPHARRHDLRLSAHSKWGGRKELKALTDILVSRLDRQSFPVDGHRLVQCRFVFADILRRTEREGFLATLRFRCVTEEVSP